jgi:hypothetical protein
MEKLPVEILCQIFKQLPQKQLIKLTTVSQQFNDIIESNKLIKGVKVDRRTDSSLPPPKRKFVKAFIRENNASSFTKALQANGDTIEELTFEHHRTTLSSIVAAINMLRNVKKITFLYVSLEDDDEAVDAVVQPLNDIHLEILESSPIICKVLHQVNLKKLHVRYYGGEF